MDTGNGRFEKLLVPPDAEQKAMEEMEHKHPQHGGWFREGEIIEIRGSLFRIKSVKPTELRLKLLPKRK